MAVYPIKALGGSGLGIVFCKEWDDMGVSFVRNPARLISAEIRPCENMSHGQQTGSFP